VLDWIADHPGLLIGAFGLSVALFVGSLIAVPMAVTRIPADYFAHEHRPRAAWRRFPRSVRIAFVTVRTGVAVVLIVAGIAMLALPGQGLLTILVGTFALDFPGKYALERRVMRLERVRGLLNRLRRRRRVPPLLHPDESPDPAGA
jgi:archaellum biogenesis protein FlaJ (TadC family)